jgi:hypothetical protein
MAWQMTGQLHELCSCKMWCPCWLGPEIEPDQGWCGGAILLDIQQGEADGVNLSGCKAVWVGDWPASFWAGNGTARVYIDERTTPEQRQALEAILTGQQGGPWAVVAGAVITTWLPTHYTPIEIHWGDDTTATIGQVGQVTSRRLRNDAGQPTTVQGAAAMAAFQLESAELAHTAGSHWADPDLHQWEGSSGTRSTFHWVA